MSLKSSMFYQTASGAIGLSEKKKNNHGFTAVCKAAVSICSFIIYFRLKREVHNISAAFLDIF